MYVRIYCTAFSSFVKNVLLSFSTLLISPRLFDMYTLRPSRGFFVCLWYTQRLRLIFDGRTVDDERNLQLFPFSPTCKGGKNARNIDRSQSKTLDAEMGES